MSLSGVFRKYWDVIQIYNHKNIVLFDYDIVDISLKTSREIEQAKKYHIIFEIAILGPKFSFLFVTFYHPYSII